MNASGQADKRGKVTITIYPIVGRQLFFRVPERICQECELTARVVRWVVAEMGNPQEVTIRIRPWLNYLPQVLLRRGWHPPVVTINGKRFSQGVVPDAAALCEAITGYLPKKEPTR